MTHDRDDALDAMFAQAREEGPSPDLMARVLADADAVQAKARPVVAPVRESWWAGLLQGLGGWSAVSGITAAGVMGLALGLYSPDTLSGLWDSDTLSLGYGTIEFTPDLGDLWTEDGDV
ncbi:hypothetical protein [Jannaschia sp. CCS1]|uniref:hypothetical protein n=1 Tax=Jannaschia sp. (strain CCS1) TaxID=290400 RepID=UPI000053DA41|nr:hypothetical protein [Jannaschia sp. CCS1]ABD56050.1 hypothetical protein Jann_3133 [Jannaschia sp. CCS1]